MSIWSDAATIVTATLSGDINFKVVQAYRSDGAWFVFGPLTIIGAIVLFYRERWAEKFEARRGRPTTNFTHPIIATFLAVALFAAFSEPVGEFFATVLGGYHRVFLIGVPILLILMERSPERTIVVYSYIIMAAIIFIGVIQRFGFSAGVPWFTTIPPLLFMIMAWYGAALRQRPLADLLRHRRDDNRAGDCEHLRQLRDCSGY